MRVLQITTNYPTKTNPVFGIFMKEQVESLEKYGVKNTIFFSNGSETNVRKRHGGMMAHVKSIFKLQWHLLTHRYDVIHCHSYISGLILAFSGGWIFNKCVVSFQNDPDVSIERRFFKMLYPLFDKIIVKLPCSYSGRKKVCYLPNGCDSERFSPMNKVTCKQKLKLCNDKRYILFVDSNAGKKRISKRKDRFDKTLQILRDKYGYQNIEELVMIGVAREEVPIWMNACDLHLLSSDQEGSPNSVKECLSCNVPVVSTDVGNVRDLLDGVSGCYMAKKKDASELAMLVDKVLSSTIVYDIRGAFIEKGFDMDSAARKIVDLYESIIK